VVARPSAGSERVQCTGGAMQSIGPRAARRRVRLATATAVLPLLLPPDRSHRTRKPRLRPPSKAARSILWLRSPTPTRAQPAACCCSDDDRRCVCIRAADGRDRHRTNRSGKAQRPRFDLSDFARRFTLSRRLPAGHRSAAPLVLPSLALPASQLVMAMRFPGFLDAHRVRRETVGKHREINAHYAPRFCVLCHFLS
jgi:hypothetical protein